MLGFIDYRLVVGRDPTSFSDRGGRSGTMCCCGLMQGESQRGFRRGFNGPEVINSVLGYLRHGGGVGS